MDTPEQYALVPIERDEVLQKKKVYKEDYGNFSFIGKLRTMKTKRNNLPEDIIDCLNKVSKGAIAVFTELKLHMSYENNLAIYSTKDFSKSHQVMFNKYVRELLHIGLIKRIPISCKIIRVPKYSYIINPEKVKCVKQLEAEELWSWLK